MGWRPSMSICRRTFWKRRDSSALADPSFLHRSACSLHHHFGVSICCSRAQRQAGHVDCTIANLEMESLAAVAVSADVLQELQGMRPHARAPRLPGIYI